MKKFCSVFVLAVMAVFTLSCEGPRGPQGPQGPSGPDTISEVFEVTANFTPSNNFQVFYDLNPSIYASDVMLVYELSGVNNGVDIWKLLPQVYTFNQGIMQYNFDFTQHDFSIFMDATFDPMTLDSSWRMNKIFRIVIVPGYFSTQVNVEDINAVMSELSLNEDSIIQL